MVVVVHKTTIARLTVRCQHKSVRLTTTAAGRHKAVIAGLIAVVITGVRFGHPTAFRAGFAIFFIEEVKSLGSADFPVFLLIGGVISFERLKTSQDEVGRDFLP